MVNIQNKLCNNIIAAEDFDCAAIHEALKELVATKMREKHESLEAAIQAAPHKLEKDIEVIKKSSEQNVLYNKKQQQNLNKIWSDMNDGRI